LIPSFISGTGDRGTITGVAMLRESTGRLLTALRVALYPAFESAEARLFQALTMEAENARGSRDLAKAERLYLTAVAAAQSLHVASNLGLARHGLARVYQEQHRYREAESILQNQLEEAAKSPQPNTLVHAGHMSLASLYQDEGKFAQAEAHYRAALAETEKTEVFPERASWCSTSIWLAKFYIARQRYDEAEPLFRRAAEILEEDQRSNSYLPHHLQEFAKLCEVQAKDEVAEGLYRRALTLREQLQGPDSLLTAWAVDALAAFCRARCRYLEAEELYRRSLMIVEKHVSSQAAACAKGWRPWRNKRELQIRLSLNEIPISTSLDHVATLCEDQQKYAESEPLRRRSLEIKERTWAERHPSFLLDSLIAHANVLRKIGLEHEASQIDERAKAIRLRYPQGSVKCSLRVAVGPVKRSLWWRFSTFVSVLLHPSR
jgi:tetratricopeptide (TPR) repeat protein